MDFLENIELEKNELQVYNGNSGLKGIWGWIKRNVHKIAAVCAVVGLPAVGVALEAIVQFTQDEGISAKMGVEYEPTASEGVILDSWVENKLTPFYRNLLTKLKLAFDLQDHNTQLEIINDVMMKMCLVEAYYRNNETSGLSPQAVNLRSEFIANIFLPIDDLIANSILNINNVGLINYTATVTNPNDFYPLNIQNFTSNCEKYVSNQSNLGNNQNTLPLLTNAPVVVNPVTNQTIVQSDNANPTNTKSNLGIILLGILGLTVLLYPDDKDKKVQKDG